MRAYSRLALGMLGVGGAFAACGGEEFSARGTGGATAGGAAGTGGAPSGGGTTAGGSGGVSASGGVAGAGGAAGVDGGGAGGSDGGCVDADNDKKTTCDGDCDDNDPNVWPGYKEVCGDLKDNDCAGGADTGCKGIGAYVSELFGNDANLGTKAAPLRTIMKGIANADLIRQNLGTPAAKVEVFIAQGTYKTEKVKLKEGISLLGGHHCQGTSNCTWNQNPAVYESIIEAVDYEGTLADGSITRGTRVESLTLRGKDGAPPASTFGATALMIDGGRPTVMSCKIEAPDTTGSWPHGRSSGIFIAASSDTAGPLIMDNKVFGGQASWAHGILMDRRPNVTSTSYAEIRHNTITGGQGTNASNAFAYVNSGSGTLFVDNDLNAGTSQLAYAFGIEALGTAAIDRNRINLPGTNAKCSGSGWCGGIACESCAGSITNNVIFGADASSSAALRLVEAEKPAGSILVHSNYLDAAGSTSGGAKGSAIVLEMGSCTSCNFKGVTGRIRGNILLLGQAASRYGVMEMAPVGKQMHPAAFEHNWFSTVGLSTSPILYLYYNGSSSVAANNVAGVTSLLAGGSVPVANNQEGDPMVDGTYHLKSGSPCVNKSTNNEAPKQDMDGQNRPMGSNYDIGPDEAQ